MYFVAPLGQPLMTVLSAVLYFGFFSLYFRGHKVIAVTLLQHGADTTIKNSSGKLNILIIKFLQNNNT